MSTTVFNIIYKIIFWINIRLLQIVNAQSLQVDPDAEKQLHLLKKWSPQVSKNSNKME